MSITYKAPKLGAEEPAEVPRDASERAMPKPDGWTGPTYYGRRN